MKTFAKKVILKNKAKTVLAGNYQGSVTMLLFFCMLALFFNRFAISLTRLVCYETIRVFGVPSDGFVILFISYLVPLLATILMNVLQAGLALFFLNVVTGKVYLAVDLLYGYFHGLSKFLRLSAVTSIVAFVFALPSNLILDANQGSLSLATEVVNVLYVLQLVLLLFYFPIVLSLSQVYYLALDYPDLSAAEIIKLSIKIMQGKKMQLFKIQLSFLPMWILGVFSLGLGLFWVVPYQMSTCALYYLDIMKPETPVA